MLGFRETTGHSSSAQERKARTSAHSNLSNFPKQDSTKNRMSKHSLSPFKVDFRNW